MVNPADFYSTDVAGNQETVRQSGIFYMETHICMNKICGESCWYAPGVCNGNYGNCYAGGGCSLGCSAPSLGPGEERIESGSCGRTGSYKCATDSVCSSSYTSCTAGGSSTQVTGTWINYTTPPGPYGIGHVVQITLGGVSNSPSGFTILTECSIVKSNGNVIYFDNWGSGNLVFSYTIQADDPEGTWTVDYCGLWSDFETNGGWNLQFNDTTYTFIVDNTPPSITINSPLPDSTHNSDFLINATVTDAWTDVDSVLYRWENGTTNSGWKLHDLFLM